jgi:DNA polymerase-3 subunit epsilon
MSFLIPLFPAKADLPTPIACAIDAWRALPAPAEDTPLAAARFVVIGALGDGFDARRARLLGIGAVAVDRLRIVPREAFSAALPLPADESVLAEEALTEFLAFAGKAPCAALHVEFARTLLDRTLRAELGVTTAGAWLDLAALAPALFPELAPRRDGVDGWLRYFGLRVLVRDNVLHDAQVAASLLLILLERALAGGIPTLGALHAAARAPQRFATGVR